MTIFERRSLTAVGLALAAFTVAACNQNQAGGASTAAPQVQALPPPLPLTMTAAPSLAPAPTAADLAPAPAAGVAYLDDPVQQYAFQDRAANLAQVLGDTPPDYGFDFAGVQPWVWRGDGFVRVVESTADGDRYFYYDAGSPTPYLIQDGGYAYAFSGDNLVVVYGPDGEALHGSDAQYRRDVAGRYLARARALYNAALTTERRAVAVDSWQTQSRVIDQDHARWEQEQANLRDWRTYHEAHQAEEGAYWQGERDRRKAEARSYHQVLDGQGAAPAAALLATAAAAYGATHAGPPGDSPRAPLAATGPQRAPDAPLHHDQPNVGQTAPQKPLPPQQAPTGAGSPDHRQPGPQGPSGSQAHGPPNPAQPSAGGPPPTGPDVGRHHDQQGHDKATAILGETAVQHSGPDLRPQDTRPAHPQAPPAPAPHGPPPAPLPVVQPAAPPPNPPAAPAVPSRPPGLPPPLHPAAHATAPPSPPPPKPTDASKRNGLGRHTAPATPPTPTAKDKRPPKELNRPDNPG